MPVAVAVTREDALSPRTDATGVLTGVRVAPGTQVDTGTVVVTVGDGDVVAYRSERPLLQDVAAGSTGGSVAVAQQLLVDLGLFAGPVDGRIPALPSQGPLARPRHRPTPPGTAPAGG